MAATRARAGTLRLAGLRPWGQRGCEQGERAGRDVGWAGGCGTVNHLMQMGSI